MNDLFDETRRLLTELDGKRFDPVGWSEVGVAAQHLEEALENRELVAIKAATRMLSQAMFEANVRGTFTRELRGRQAVPAVVPTKRTSSLPIVGLVCGVPILAIGYLLGGGLLLVLAVIFEVFILVVALAGSRVANRPADVDDGAEPPTPPPAEISARLERIEELVYD